MPERPTEKAGPDRGVYDDDRLLSCALGLDDDPELLKAAAGDPALAGRLAAMRGDAATVAAHVGRAVPAPDDAYTDLADARWTEMRPYIHPSPSAGSRTRLSHRLRIAVPLIAVAVLALAVGLTAVYRSGDQVAIDASRETVGSAAQMSAAADAGPTFAEELDHFTVVVLAKAGKTTGALQRFAVVRVLKGEMPSAELLELRVGDTPAAVGRLHLLMLQPVAGVDTEEDGAEGTSGPTAAKSGREGPGRVIPASYSYQGEPVVARELPADTDPQSVTLP